MTSKECGNFISELRKEKELTQKELAEKINVSDKAISRWETGKGYLDVTSLVSLSDYFDVAKFREEISGKRIRLIALVTSFVDASLLGKYDESISIFDDLETLSKKIAGLLNVVSEEEGMDNQDTLSQREKEIVICVVKGMTNKEIAEKLFLSIHTVITHRRNISKKLQIHSAAGLTIYAIVNKLVALSDVKDL